MNAFHGFLLHSNWVPVARLEDSRSNNEIHVILQLINDAIS